MRARVHEFLKVLNRAKPEAPSDREKKTARYSSQPDSLIAARRFRSLEANAWLLLVSHAAVISDHPPAGGEGSNAGGAMYAGEAGKAARRRAAGEGGRAAAEASELQGLRAGAGAAAAAAPTLARPRSEPTALELLACVAGIYACFLTWGVLQERVSTTPYGEDKQRFRFFVTMNAVQAAIAAAVATAYLRLAGKRPARAGRPTRALLRDYGKVAFLQCISSPFGYAALRYIDYPTMILGKSCKLLPVMLMNVVLYRKSFPLYKYVAVALITAGVASFTLLQPVKDPSKVRAGQNSLYGLALLTVNLLIDGVTSSAQDNIFHVHKVTGTQMMFWMNAFSCAFTAAYLAFDHAARSPAGEVSAALAFCRSHPAVLFDVVMFGTCGALGQCFIFHTIERFGSLRLVTVTVTRKLFTMLLSVAYFGHRLTLGQWASVALVFSGIGMEAYIKSGRHTAAANFVKDKTHVR
ncbi:MAG: UAA transporter family-domain-containing protein [Olpidium bornovanus]|uniref:UDP-galactose transporter homolog 1 n=1 Tax=Olpidium bornovanus TaxID=278681 RepID=A0A8H7ZVZ2_9FUNG|nr:MAG: UAA transporter family-domain-containing protein [Olpidium bornovanus]